MNHPRDSSWSISPARKLQIRRWYALILPYEALSSEQRAVVDGGGLWPVVECEHLPEHEDFLEFLIATGLTAWRGSR